MHINDIVKQVHANAKEKGWHDTPRSPLEFHMLIVSEIAEATECARNLKDLPIFFSRPSSSEPEKPEGEAIELADAVIRIMDYFGLHGWNLEECIRLKMEYNKTRAHRHGNKLF